MAKQTSGTDQQSDTIKKQFLGNLEKSLGIIASACKKTEINRSTYYDWRHKDQVFAAACDLITEDTSDFVESKLLQKINEGDTAAIIFYCKTKMRSRGYDGKDKRVAIELPKLDNIHSVRDALDLVVNKLASTEITDEQGATLIQALEHERKMIEVVDLAKRLEEVERRLQG